MFANLTPDNITLYVAHTYSNPSCVSMTEFRDDVRRIKYVTRLLRRYHETGTIKIQLLVNHLTLLKNVFAPQDLVRILVFKIDPTYYSSLKAVLHFFYLLPDSVPGIRGKTIWFTRIPKDRQLATRLTTL